MCPACMATVALMVTGATSVGGVTALVMKKLHSRSLPGMSVFLREGDSVFHTYSTYQRGLDLFLNTYNFLDTTPLGRQEDGDRSQGWIRHHDKYEA